MVGRKKKTKICDKGSHGDWISKLPDNWISEILSHLPTKDAVRTSVLSTRWRNIWKLIPGLDLDSDEFSNFDAFECFVDRFFDSHKDLCIRKLRLSYDSDSKSPLSLWINVVTMRGIQYLDVPNRSYRRREVIPLSIYTCQTLVHLRLCWVGLAYAEFVSLPYLKIIHLEYVHYLKEATLEKLISGSPVLEDLTIIGLCDAVKAIVRSQTLKRIHMDISTDVVIDAPLLQLFRTTMYSTKNFKIINLGFSTRLDIDVTSRYAANGGSFISDILTDISRVRDLVISNVFWKDIFLCSKSVPLLEFRHLSRLNAKFSTSDLEKLPTILESCPELESLTLELVKYPPFTRHKKNREPKVMFSTVPRCLISTLKFVEWKRSSSGYEGEKELVRYILKNSIILEKLRVDISYNTNKAKCAFLKELLTMRRCSNACEVNVL